MQKDTFTGKMKDKIDDDGGGRQEQPTTKKARLSIVNEITPLKEEKQKSPCCDIRPPPLVLDLDADLNRALTFEAGAMKRTVVVDHQIAEGGFGAIFVARDATSANKKRRRSIVGFVAGGSIRSDGGLCLTRSTASYALKRIDCCNIHGQTDQEKIDMCSREASLHSTFDHKNLMPIFGIQFTSEEKTKTSCTIKTCYMLFPYIPTSIRSDISARRLLEDTLEDNRRPYSEIEALDIFSGICDGVRTLHEYGYSHRDLKVENILLRECDKGPGIPIITDFGSVGPVAVPLTSHATVVKVEEDIAKFTSIEYRAPELLEPKLLPYGLKENLNYGKSDVWALGCVFFAMLYGSSPFEIEWGISFVGEPSDATARLTLCTKELIRGEIPFPPGGSAADRRYRESFRELIECMLNQDRFERLNSENIFGRVQKMLENAQK